MALLYRLGDDICIEMSSAAMTEVEKAVRNWLAVDDVSVNEELECFVSKLRAHLQHTDMEPRQPAPVSGNSDLT